MSVENRDRARPKICHYHRGPFQDECPLGGKCETLEDWKPTPPAGANREQAPESSKLAQWKNKAGNFTADVDVYPAQVVDKLADVGAWEKDHPGWNEGELK